MQRESGLCFPPFSADCLHFLQKKCLSGFYWEQMLCVHPGAFARAKMALVVGACMAMHTPGKRSCSWSLRLQLAWIEGRIELWPAHGINSSILCLSHVDQPSQEGDTALYSCAARPSAGASQALLLPCSKATWPAPLGRAQSAAALCTPAGGCEKGQLGSHHKHRLHCAHQPVCRPFESVRRTSHGSS